MGRTFAAFVLSHGRPDSVITTAALGRSGYTGRTYVVVDNEDPTADAYRERFGAENVLVFDKAAVAETFDPADTQTDRRSVVYARNACFGLARELGLSHFVELDDDYTDFLYRYSEGLYVRGRLIRNLDAVIEATLDLLDDTGAATVAWSQGGDHMGWRWDRNARLRAGFLRKAMNSFFLRTDRPLTFLGRVNEDVSTYVVEGSRGRLFLTTMGVQLNQVATQSSAGGMTDLYRETGTYVKSFYSVMMAPSSVSITTMGRTERRFHHRIRWDSAVPKILSAELRAGVDA